MKSFLGAVAVLACVGLTGSAVAGTPTGTWKGTISVQNQRVESMFALRFDTEGPTLTGGYIDGLSNREAPISQARFNNSQVSFSVVREIDGQRVTVQYGGTLRGDTITGKCNIDYGNRSQSSDWVASRQK